MTVTAQQMEKLLQGEYVFTQWAFSMLLTRLKTAYAASPGQANLEKCVGEINTFLEKYQAIMAQDFAVIQNI